MTKELTTRGPFDTNPGVLVRWMLKSGERSDRPMGAGSRVLVRDGIQLYVPHQGGVTVLDFKDVHEAGDLYVALEEHMENVAGDQERAGGVGPVEEARLMTEEERRNMTPNTPARILPEPARWTDADGEKIRAAKSGATVPASFFKGEVWPGVSVDPEFLEAMDDVLQAWLNPAQGAILPIGRQDHLRAVWPTLAAALDRLAALNA